MVHKAHIPGNKQLRCEALRLLLGIFVCAALTQTTPLRADIELEKAQAEQAERQAQERVSENLLQQDAESERLGDLHENAYEERKIRHREIPAQPTRPTTHVTTLLIPEQIDAPASSVTAIPAGTSDDAIREVTSRRIPVSSSTTTKDASARIQDFSGRKPPSKAWKATREINQYVPEFRTHN